MHQYQVRLQEVHKNILLCEAMVARGGSSSERVHVLASNNLENTKSALSMSA